MEKVCKFIFIKDVIIIKQINLNLDVQELSEVGMIISKRKKDNKLYIFSMYTEGDTHYKLYADVVQNHKNREDVISSLSKCLNLWATCNYRKDQPYAKLFDACVGVFAFGKKTNTFSLIVDGEKPELVEIMQSKYKGKNPTTKHMTKTLKIFNNFKPKDISELYNHIVKYL